MAIETLRSLANAAGIEDMPVLKRKSMGGSIGYDAAARGRRGAGWTPTRSGINTLYSSAGETVVSRARDAVRNSGWAASALESWVANVVGQRGMRMISLHPDEMIRESITKTWLKWCKQCDSEFQIDVPGSGVLDFGGFQQLVAREVWEAGEVFIRVHMRPKSERLTVPIQLQLLESEQLPVWRMASGSNIPPGNTVRSGIEYDPLGRRVAYHFYKVHPGETMFFSSDGLSTERIPAKFIVPVHEMLRAGQMRGVPRLTPILAKLNEIEKLTDAELVRKATCSMITGIITKTGQESPFAADAVAQPSNLDTAITNIQPGTMIELLPGEDAQLVVPPDDGGFPEALISFLKAFAAGAGIPYHQVTGDLRETSFSSIRAGVIEFRLRAQAYQCSVFEQRMLEPIFQLFLRFAVLSGALDLPDYAKDPGQYEEVRWQPAGWPWVDPLKDIEATQLEIQCGLNTRTAAAAERGLDAAQIDEERSREMKREKTLGLTYATEPPTVPNQSKSADQAGAASEEDGAAAPPPMPKKKPNGVIVQ